MTSANQLNRFWKKRKFLEILWTRAGAGGELYLESYTMGQGRQIQFFGRCLHNRAQELKNSYDFRKLK